MKARYTHTDVATAGRRYVLLRDDEGAMAYLVAVMIVVLLAFAAVVVDAGALYSDRRQMQTAADAAALAGVQELPSAPGSAQAAAGNYASINSPDATDSQYIIGSTFVANDTITAELEDPSMGLFFARFMGIETAPVTARATAVIGSPRTYGSGVMPFGILAKGTTAAPYGYNPGQMIELVCYTDDHVKGNWHYVDLTPLTEGASQTKRVIANGGTTDPLSIGDYLETQPGEPNVPNFGALVGYFDETCGPHDISELVYDADRGVYEPTHAADGTHCNRLITCPVIIIAQGDPYSWDSVNGKTTTQVVGFLNMFISNNPQKKDGHLEARFAQVVPVDTFNPSSYVEYGGVVYWLSE